MKKKGILIFVVLLISLAAIFFANGMQKKLVSNEVASKTESTVLNGDLKENTNEDSKKDDNINTQNTDKAINSEIKNEDSKDASKTAQQNSSNKVNETSKKNTSKTVAPKSSNTNTAASTNASQTSNSGTNPNQSSSLQPNFIVRDARNNNILVSKHIEFNGGTVADITKRNVEYKVKSGDYFYEIAGIKERSDGPLSGWCYFINGSKPGIGAGNYVLKKDDTIEWKFLKDGVNN